MTRRPTIHTSIPAFITLLIYALTTLLVLAGIAIAQNPVPFVDQPLVPDATAPGGAGFTLTVNGAGFVSTSVVNWNGSPRATTYVSSSKLTAAILASDVAKASTASVTVVSPSPGGGVSNTAYFSITVPDTSVSFSPEVQYSAGAFATTFVAVADLNGDGIPDLAAAIQNCPSGNCSDGKVSIMLGNGDGTFQTPVLYESGGKSPNCVAVADVNGDGKPDIVVMNSGQSDGRSVGVLLGNGDGTFQPVVTSSTTGLYLAVADVNGDGKLDVIISDAGSVNVLLGNGDGTFRAGVLYAAYAYFVAVADVNGDGVPDLVTAGAMPDGDTGIGAVSVLLGNGDGTFQPALTYLSGASLGSSPYSLAVADVNADGKPDIVAANYPDGTVGVLLGNGNGTFQPVILYSSGGAGSYSWSVTIADLNGDGKADLAVGNIGSVGVLLGRGDGTFRSALAFAGGADTPNVVAADLNGDGRPDLVAPDGGLDVSVWLNNSTSSQSPTTTTLSSSLNPSIYGQAVTFTATVTSSSGTPTGTVIFYNGTTNIGSGTLTSGKTSISISSLPAGSDSITAAYQGSATFASSTSTPLIQTVSAASTTTTLTSSLNPAGTGQTITFTATVTSQFGGAATGLVTFYSGTQTLGTATLSGNRATLSTSFSSAGTYAITAKYSGDANNTASTSAVLNEVIIASTTTTLVSSLNPSTVGQSVTFTATVTSTAGVPPNGEIVTFYITFYNGSAILGSGALGGGVASFATSALAAGIYSITASYPGDANFAASTSAVLRQVVNSTTKSATTTTLASSPNPSIYGQSVTFTAIVTTTGTIPPTGTVVFQWNDLGQTLTLGSATLNASGVATLTKSNLNADAYPVTAVYKGDVNNLGSTSAIVNQVVTQASSSATLTSSPNPSATGEAVTFTAKITSPTVTAKGPVTFTAGKTTLGTVELSAGKATLTTSSLAAGSTVVTVTYTGDSDIKGSSASVTQVVQ